MAFTDDQIVQWLTDNADLSDKEILSAMQNFQVTPEQVAAATGAPIGSINDRIGAVVNDAYASQLGAPASDAQYQAAMEYLFGGGFGGVEQGIRNINNSQEGYNYDTQDIVSAYRQAYGRNPSQEEYVQAMASLGLDNFDRGALQGGGNFTSAQMAALEADPFAGRYAGYNPYQLPADAVNVSTNKLGDSVQYISPVTQRPAVASYENGQLVVREGQDVLTGQQAQAAIGLATSTGALSKEDYSQLMTGLNDAKSIEDMYAALSGPQATAALDPKYGFQTGSGKTLADALRNSPPNANAVVAGLGAQAGNRLPSNAAMSDWAKQNQIPYQFDSNLYSAMYGGMKPATQANVATPQRFPEAKADVLAGSQLGRQKGLDAGVFTPSNTGWGNRTVVGAAGNEMLGAGAGDYQSDMIKALRQQSITPISNNAGVIEYRPAANAGVGMPINTVGGNAAFNPSVLQQNQATPQEIENWNDYSAYRMNELNDKKRSDLLSFDDWMTQQSKGSTAKAPAGAGGFASLLQTTEAY